MFTNSASVANQSVLSGVPMQPVPDWYPSPDQPKTGDHREQEPITLQLRNRKSGGNTGSSQGSMPCPITPKVSPSTGGASAKLTPARKSKDLIAA